MKYGLRKVIIEFQFSTEIFVRNNNLNTTKRQLFLQSTSNAQNVFKLIQKQERKR